jgi:hypothetical protein
MERIVCPGALAACVSIAPRFAWLKSSRTTSTNLSLPKKFVSNAACSKRSGLKRRGKRHRAQWKLWQAWWRRKSNPLSLDSLLGTKSLSLDPRSFLNGCRSHRMADLAGELRHCPVGLIEQCCSGLFMRQSAPSTLRLSRGPCACPLRKAASGRRKCVCLSSVFAVAIVLRIQDSISVWANQLFI